ncbi:DUF1015 domain-containing protein [Streptomyces sp. NPDC005438]|uniref:DUF1015 domain-containing protein n=1 Tax=Streptomyces sp. NPDC005438 TaxID=3156880 RepID=UPI0033A2F845
MTLDGLHLAPFRGLRYVPERVSSFAAVTSPPYDVVVKPDGLHHLETADPFNIVRLILPHAGGDPESSNRQAATTLNAWTNDGVLAADPEPALYVYEQRRGEVLQRGLIGALRLTPPEEGVVLPHEDVIPEVVAERADLMRHTRANLEPLLLSYRGGDQEGGASAVIQRAIQRHPLLSTTTEDGFQHQLWAVTDPDELAEIHRDLSAQHALIADGHHRWATYLRLQEAEHAPDSSWSYGLVLLVDTHRYPLRVQAIHRVLPHLPTAKALDQLTGVFRVRPLNVPLDEALETLRNTEGNAYLLASGPETFHLLHTPDPDLVRRSLDPERPEAWRSLDATVLHSLLLDRVWQIPDHPSQIGYLHDAEAAVAQAAHHGGTAVLMRPVEEETVREIAQLGITMPRKSTSFGPKPATGLVLRRLEDD